MPIIPPKQAKKQRCLIHFSCQVLMTLTWEIPLDFFVIVCVIKIQLLLITVMYLIKQCLYFILWLCSVLCLHLSCALLVKNLYECAKVNYCYIFKVPEVPKKFVVEEEVHVPEEPKVVPAKGIFLCWFTTNTKLPFIHLLQWRTREIILPSTPQNGWMM